MPAKSRSVYYVYVYIDPRNHQEFYYGKGCGNRKDAHGSDSHGSEKGTMIKAIEAQGLEPIVRVIVANLDEQQALLVEKTLLWKLGHQLTNLAPGHFKTNFRPPNTLHKKIPGFDFRGGIYYVNVCDCEHRAWEDCKKYGLLAAGHGTRWSDQLKRLNEGDVVLAYQRGKGYVGVGTISSCAVPVRDFRVRGKQLSKFAVKCKGIFHNSDDDANSEYLVGVDWKIAKSLSEAIWKPRAGLFTSQKVSASLANQQKTIRFIERKWDFDLESITS